MINLTNEEIMEISAANGFEDLNIEESSDLGGDELHPTVQKLVTDFTGELPELVRTDIGSCSNKEGLVAVLRDYTTGEFINVIEIDEEGKLVGKPGIER